MEREETESALERGAALIRDLVARLPEAPGVYRMLAADGAVLYVGKARLLKRRVASYTQIGRLSGRLRRMVAATAAMEFVVTHTEAEALLLEATLIKTLRPRYNILLRDDKSYPWVWLTGGHDFPRLLKHRGARDQAGDYFGPFASTTAVNETVAILQRVFQLRTCSDSEFARRERPCLQYHIKRCTAPCVGLIDRAAYGRQVAEAREFLTGKSRALQDRYADAMQQASDALDFEAAARYRDRIRALTAVQSRQDVSAQEAGDADVIGLYQDGGRSCVQVFFFRGGQSYGNRSFFPRHEPEEGAASVLEAFLAQFYADKPAPADILLSRDIPDRSVLEEALSARAGHRVRLTFPMRGARRRLIDLAVTNAREALERERAGKAAQEVLLAEVARLFELDGTPDRIEIYDNSHTGGTHMVGAMVVAGPEGLRKAAWRKFTIREAAKGDDFGMMREVLRRRFSRVRDEDGADGFGVMPDLVLIDGGAGQISAVMAVLDELGLSDQMRVVGVAKGPDRNAGRETFFMPGREPFQLPPRDPVLHYLQRLRDEAHRFAIGTHRAKRAKAISETPLDDIPGIGPARRRALLRHFGSARAVAEAGIPDLEQVAGLSRAVAQRIYAHFHGSAG